MEAALAQIWARLLDVPQVSRNDNFFSLGGHSLLCLQAITEVEKTLGVRLSPRIFLLNNLEQIGAQLSAVETQAENDELDTPGGSPLVQRLIHKFKQRLV